MSDHVPFPWAAGFSTLLQVCSPLSPSPNLSHLLPMPLSANDLFPRTGSKESLYHRLSCRIQPALPSPPRCHGPRLRPAAGLLPSFIKDRSHPLKQDPSSSLLCHWFSFLFSIFPILRTGLWNPGYIQLLPLSSATFYSCLLCGQQKSCPSVPSLVFLPSLV